MAWNIGLIVLGFLLLIKGGDYLVDGAVAIARRAKLSPMVIGLTIVGFGTSAPELLVSLQASLANNSGIAVGNVVGSNIANIALILGVTALIAPCSTDRQTLRVDAPFMISSCTLFVTVAMMFGGVSRWVGLVSLLLLLAFVTWQVWNSRKNNQKEENPENEPAMALWKAIIIVVGSILALTYGADWLIQGATGVARAIGISDRIIGLTIIAVGTSLPELFASVMSARKGETDMAIGNVIGSITFNILCVIGVSSAICPIEGIDPAFSFDFILMIGLSVLLWIFLYTHRMLVRWEGFAFLAIYVAYIARTVLLS